MSEPTPSSAPSAADAARPDAPRREAPRTDEPTLAIAPEHAARSADFLGWFSVGLGLAEVLAPHAMARVIGVKHPDRQTHATMRLMGLREIGSGVAILRATDPTPAVWARVAGDALDLSLLGRTAANPRNHRGRTLFATLNVLAITALDVLTARGLQARAQPVGA